MHARSRLVLTASIVAAASGGGLPIWAFAQNSLDAASGAMGPMPAAPEQPANAQDAPKEASKDAPKAPPRDAPAGRGIRFQLKDAPLSAVLEFFAKESGVPIIYESAVPAGQVTFVGTSEYSFDDALSILNLNLQRFGLLLRKQDQYLYLATLQDAMKKPSPVSDPKAVDGLSPDKVVTVNIPLDNARADLVAEQLKPLIGQYGAILSVPAQNMVVLVESAAQVQRLRKVIEAIDAVRPVDSAFKLFPLKHAQAEAVVTSLRGLLGERIVTTFIDKDGKKTTTQDVNVAGLQLQADPRTNAVVAVGSASRIEQAKELIELLDVTENADTTGGTQMATFSLSSQRAEDAASQLTGLFSTVEEKRRPKVLALPQVAKVTVVGTAGQIAQASTLLNESDPGASQTGGGAGVRDRAHRTAMVRLLNVTPAAIEATLLRLSTARQQQVIKFAATPDGRGMIVSGPDGDVTQFEQLITGLDQPGKADRDVRQLRLDGDAATVAGLVARAKDLYAKTDAGARDPVDAASEPGTNVVTLVGSRDGLAAFDRVLRSVRDSAAGDREVRRYSLTNASASTLAGRLSKLSKPMLDPADGASVPEFEGVDEIGVLVVRAHPRQFSVLDGMIRGMDVADVTSRDMRVVRVMGGAGDGADSAKALLDRVQRLYAVRTQGVPDTKAGVVSVELDNAGGVAVLSGRPDGVRVFTQVLEELQKGAGAVRELRLIELKQARASDVAATLRDLLSTNGAIRASGGPAPEIEVIEKTNSLLVSSQTSQLAILESLVNGLDARGLEGAERPPLRILRLRSSDAENLAGILRKNYDGRPAEERAKTPVAITADPATNTLIVSAHPSALTDIERLVAELNEQQAANADGREIRIFPLKVARAEELAQTIDQMYPEPPVPLDPRTRQPRPDLKQPKEVVLRADRGTNSLIVDAPARRLAGFEQLVKNLDQQRLAEDVVVRTYSVERADLNAVANTLRQLSSQNALGGAHGGVAGGAAQASISINTEPVSRTLIVSGPAGVFEGVEKVLKELDAPPAMPASEMKLYALVHAKAGRLQPLLDRVLNQRLREALSAEGKSLPAGSGNERLIDVSADEVSNTLIISAPRSVISTADGLVKALDQQAVASGVEVRVFRLGKGDARTIAPAITQAIKAQAKPGEPDPAVTPEPGSNTIVVVGTAEQIERAGKLVESMDAAVDRDGLGVKTVMLKHARSEAIAPVIQRVLQRESSLAGLPPWLRQQAIANGTKESAEVRVASEPRLNALVISGPKAVLDVAEQVIAELDVDPVSAGGGGRDVRVLTLENADASQLAASLQAMFLEDSALEAAPTIRVDAASNSMIVRATDSQMKVVDELTRKLDKAAGVTSRQMKVVPLDRSKVDAEMLAKQLRRLVQQQGGRVEVVSLEELLRRSADDGTPEPDKKLETPDEGEAGKKSSDVVWPIRAIDSGMTPRMWIGVAATWAVMGGAIEAEPAAELNLKDEASNDEGVTIGVDPATNSLLLIGSPRATERLAAIAAQLQQQMPSEPVSVRIVTLPPSLDAGSLAGVVNQTMQQMGRASAQNPGGWSGTVSVSADPVGGALIVLANDTDFAGISRLISSIARIDSTMKITVKLYPLTNVTAQRVIQSARELFSSQPAGAQARRIKQLDISLAGKDGPVSGRIDPSQIRLAADGAGTSVIASAPSDAIPLLDELVQTLDQNPVKDRLAIRRYELKNAQAVELAGTLQNLFEAQRQGPVAWELPQARFVADARTNTLLVTASGPQHNDVARLLETADVPVEEPGLELAVFNLQQANPGTVRQVVDDVVIGKDQAKRQRVKMSVSNDSNLLVVRASKDVLEQIRTIVGQVDSAELAGLPVRSIKLERADAGLVATALQKFFQDRATVSSKPGRRAVNRVAVAGDKRTGTVIVSASDDEFEQVKTLVATFDSPTPSQDFQFRVLPLKHARVSEVINTVKSIVDERRWERMFAGGQGEGGVDPAEQLYVEGNERTNSVVVIGRGETIGTIERVLSTLDVPGEERTKLALRSVRVDGADLSAIRTAIQRAFATPGWSSWRGADPDAVTAEIDRVRRAIVLVGKAERVAEAEKYISELDQGPAGKGSKLETISLQHAKADRAANSLRQFFSERARSQGVDQPGITVIGSTEGNVLIVAGAEDELKTLKDLIAQIDLPDVGKDRRVEVFVLRNAQASEAAGVLRSMFASKGRAEESVAITPQPSTNSLIVSAPESSFEQIKALLDQLDAGPTKEDVNVETVALSSARAVDVARELKAALPTNVKVVITPVTRSNSLMLTGSKPAIALVLEQVKKLDTEPMRTGLVYRKFKLTNAEAAEVYFTVQKLVESRPRPSGDGDSVQLKADYSRLDNTISVYALAEQIEDIEKIIKDLDQPTSNDKSTEFIKLQFANAAQTADALRVFYGRFAPEAASPAARNVTILHDPLSNSLVIRAEKSQWEGVRALLAKLDTKDYDTARQLAVIPLVHADAASVARALNDGLRAPLEEQIRQAQSRSQARNANGANRVNEREMPPATVLVNAETVPAVSPESQTNSLIVFAGARDMERIRDIVKQIDVLGFEDMPPARIIPIKRGKPSQVAGTIRELFLNKPDTGKGAGSLGGPRSVVIIGDDASSALIVRADEEKFAQVKALADTLQQQGELGAIAPHVVRLKNMAAGRLRQTLVATFTETAKSYGESLAIEVDRDSNSLVIACSPRLLEQIQRVILELDAPETKESGRPDQPGTASAIGQSVFVIDVTNNAPEDIRRILEDMGVTKPQPADRPGVVSEPVTISLLKSRRAIAVVAGSADGRAIENLVKAIDAAPVENTQQLAVVPLKLASVQPLVATLNAMLKPTEGGGGTGSAAGNAGGMTGPARAMAEHVRRLGIVKPGIEQTPAQVDLTKPLRLVADIDANAVVIASTPDNIIAIKEMVKLLDTLPIGDAVVIRIFPLDNASADRVQKVIGDLFKQGENLRRLPGTKRQGLPPTATGQALAGEIAVSTDDRTNTLIVAGREEAVALVEVLVKDLDGDRSSKWIEAQVLPLKYADATALAARLQLVLVKGLPTSPEAIGLQRQFGRLRMLREAASKTVQPDKSGTMPADAYAEADLFSPITGLTIVAEEQLNALLVVGTPANIEVVKQLLATLDVEAAAASNEARIFPLQHAASERVAAMLRDIFRQRQQALKLRPEDELIVTSDVRTNSLVISTSPRSFAIVDSLLKTLDGEKSNPSVSLHVLPVSNGDVRQLAPRIERLMKERISAASQSGSIRNPLDAFSIEPEPLNNLLIVAASDENFQVVKELFTALTADADKLAGAQRVEIIQLARARAPEILSSVQTLYVEKENQRRGGNSVSVQSNERLNALVVTGTDQDIIELRAITARLDNAAVTAKQQVKWIELRSANSVEVVNLLQTVLAGRPVGGGRGLGNRQATVLQFLRDRVISELSDTRGTKPTEAEIDGAIKDQVTLTADVRTNSVWISAPESIVTIVSEMIADIEQSSAGSRKIEQFRLLNADARQMATLLKDIFNLRQQGESYVLVPVGRTLSPNATNATSPQGAGSATDAADAPNELSAATVTAVPDQRQQLAIAVDPRTNTLIVSGTEEYLGLVRDVVTKLDGLPANEREQRVYHLRNVKAREIETTLKSYFKGESDLERTTLGPDRSGSIVRMLEQEVTVVGDEKANKLVISTSPRYMDTVLKIVDELDAAPPQVMIQVLLAEVTLDSNEEWGVDVAVGPIGGQGYKVATSATNAGVATGLGVPNLSVSAADFSVLVRALEAQGRLEVLSNPQVMVNNNQKASIKVGDSIGVAGQTQRSGISGDLISSVDRLDVGILLDVTPSISADGFVRMDIKPEISQLSTQTTQINKDQTSPIINKRTVDTVVTVKDGQSVVIGGLIQTTEQQRRTKVPILGDIPILGLPFQSRKDTMTKTELLVILTPRVIPGQAAETDSVVRDVTERAIDRLEDPTKVQDYLQRVREEVRRKRLRDWGLAPSIPTAPTEVPPAPDTPPLNMSPGVQIIGPRVTPAEEHP